MAKKVLIISTSLRGGSNSEILAKECERGTIEAELDVEYVSLKGKTIQYCIGCLVCQSKGACVLQDDVAEIMDKVKNAESIVFATPIYYYEMCGQMKTLLERLNPLYQADHKFRNIYMIATAAEDEESTFDKAYNGLQGWVDCFEKASLFEIVTGGGITDANEAGKYAEVMKKAYELGRGLANMFVR
ncbi:flavodoxin family protein [Cellulosilyticum ruminicola]|uniref:flavodoxin family protein n=1 Tax=Cellulosilyticum ruminicola TaxID=425254 RepID=UPI0006D25D0F|nr:flavodoxin family protein [Cellulosilyticum ruminicola]